MPEERQDAGFSVTEDGPNGAKFVLSQGTGTPLRELPAVQAVGSRGAAFKKLEAQLELLHRLVFGRAGKAGERRRALESFCGFPQEMREDISQKVHKLTKEKLRDLIKALGMPVQISKTQSQVADDVTDFLMEPHGNETKVKVSSPKGKAVKRTRRASPSGGSADAVKGKKSAPAANEDKGVEEKPKRVKKEVPAVENVSSASPPSDDAIRVAVYKRVFVTPREERSKLTTKTLRLELEKLFGDLEGRKAVIKEAASECVFALVEAEKAASATVAYPTVYTSRNGSGHVVEPSPAPQPPQFADLPTMSLARSQALPQVTPDVWTVPQTNVPTFPAYPPLAADAVSVPPQ